MKLLRDGERWTVQYQGQEPEVALVALLMAFLGVTNDIVKGPVNLLWSLDTLKALRLAAGRTAQAMAEPPRSIAKAFPDSLLAGKDSCTGTSVPTTRFVAPSPVAAAIPKLPPRLVKRPKRKKGRK